MSAIEAEIQRVKDSNALADIIQSAASSKWIPFDVLYTAADAILASDWYADHTYQLRRCNRIRQEQAAEIVSLRAELAAARRAP